MFSGLYMNPGPWLHLHLEYGETEAQDTTETFIP